MIGIYDYTVILTYLSLLSAGSGIVISLSGDGHPYFGMFFLLFCGLCDAFDGKVARTKENRSDMEKNYGIQIDSLSDVVAFGVLPACIGVAVLWRSPLFNSIFRAIHPFGALFRALLFAMMILYILAAVIRLAYFNVTEEERQKKEGGVRAYYTGLPVTSASIVFPMVLVLQYLTPNFDISFVYPVLSLVMGGAFLSKLQIRKPTTKGILVMIAIGAAEGVAMILFRFVF